MIKRLLIAVAILCAVTGAQVPVTPILQPHVVFVDAAGEPCAGCKLYSYTAGTTTPFPTYIDSTGTSQNTDPIVLDASGGPATPSGSSGGIWTANSSYKFILKDALGATIWTVDNVKGGGGLGGVCGPSGAIQISNTAINGLTCDSSITINPTNHTLNVGTIGANHVTIGALGTPTLWNFDTTTPATAVASLKAQFTGNYTSGAGVNEFQVLEGGIDPSTEFKATNNAFNQTSSIYGGLVVPSTSTTQQSAGLMGAVKSFSTSFITSAVGVYGSGHCMVTSCQAWGGNFLVQDESGTFNDLLWGIEADANIRSSTTHGYGIDVAGRWAVQPTIFFPALMVHKPVNYPGDTTGDYRWTSGLEFETGALFGDGKALVLNPQNTGVSQRSQLIRWNSTNSSGVQDAYSVDEDMFGNLLFFPGGGGPPAHGSGTYISLNVDGSISENFSGTGGMEAFHLLQPTLGTGNVLLQVIGASETLNNAAVLQFGNNGGAGSTTNVAALGVFGASAGNLTVDGNANVVTHGTYTGAGVTATSLAGSGKALACLDASGNLYRGTATTCP